MINHAYDDKKLPELQEVCSKDPVFGNKIIANLKAYSNHCNFCDFWVGYTDDIPTVAISSLGGAYVVVALENADLTEVAEFFSFMPKAPILGRLSVVQAITEKMEGNMESSPIMMYAGGPRYLPEDLVERAENLSKVYDLLKEAYPGFSDFAKEDSWIADASLRIRRGLCYCCYIRYGGRPVATGMISSASHNSVVFGSVATLPDYRNKGYGKAIMTHLCNVALLKAKRPYLCCMNKELVPYYVSLGFKTVDDWGTFTPLAETK